MIYEVCAYNHDRTIEFDKKFIDGDYARFIFETAMECCDVWVVQMCDATTGEVIMDYNRKSGILASYNI